MTLSIDVKRTKSKVSDKQEPVYVDSSRFPKDFPEYKPGMTITKPKQQEDWYGQHQWQCGYERGWDAAMEQKREWVGLTDEELEPLCDEWRIMLGSWAYDFAKAIEAKLKEKNT